MPEGGQGGAWWSYLINLIRFNWNTLRILEVLKDIEGYWRILKGSELRRALLDRLIVLEVCQGLTNLKIEGMDRNGPWPPWPNRTAVDVSYWSDLLKLSTPTNTCSGGPGKLYSPVFCDLSREFFLVAALGRGNVHLSFWMQFEDYFSPSNSICFLTSSVTSTLNAKQLRKA